MHAIIINTLGTAFARKDVFFRAFRPEQISWINCELDSVGEAAEKIVQLSGRQTTRQDYHLAVLVSLEQYYRSDLGTARQTWKKIINAYLMKALFEPLTASDCYPGGITEIFTYQYGAQSVGSDLASEYSGVLRIDGTKDLPEVLEIPFVRNSGESSVLSLPLAINFPDDDHFIGSVREEPSAGIKPLYEARPIEVDDDEDDELASATAQMAFTQKKQLEKERDLREVTEHRLKNLIEQKQTLRLPRSASVGLVPNMQELAFYSSDPKVANADLQINLAKLIKFMFDLTPGTFPHTDFTFIRSHTVEQLQSIIGMASATIDRLIANEDSQYYYELEEPYTDADYAGLKAKILNRLRAEVANVPGVKDALTEIDTETSRRNLPEAEKSRVKPVRKLRSYWFLFSREQKRFRKKYAALQEQYNRDTVRENQKQILDICADCFVKWRTEHRQTMKPGKLKPETKRRPMLSKDKRAELEQARSLCSEGTLDQLNDFQDVREEAADIMNRFRTVTRVWSPDDAPSKLRRFYGFAVIMAVVFVALMILPYVLIDSKVAGLPILKVTLYALTFLGFLLLYCFGVLRWMRKRTSETRELTVELDQLIRDSAEQRKESILRAIETYSTKIPAYMVRKLNLQAMERDDERNSDIDRKLALHKEYLIDAKHEIDDLSTALRLEWMGERFTPRNEKLDFIFPPYAPVNRDAYMFFDDGGADK